MERTIFLPGPIIFLLTVVPIVPVCMAAEARWPLVDEASEYPLNLVLDNGCNWPEKNEKFRPYC